MDNELIEKYKRYYGNQYQCYSLNAKHLSHVFIEECQRYGLLYKMEDIIQAYKKERQSIQLSLF